MRARGWKCATPLRHKRSWVVIEFASVQRAVAAHDSAGYQEALKLLCSAAAKRGPLVDLAPRILRARCRVRPRQYAISPRLVGFQIRVRNAEE